MGAAGGVNVVVAGIPASFCGIDPAFQVKYQIHRLLADVNTLRLPSIFRAARVLDRVIARRQQQIIAISPIHLRLKREIGREPLGL